MESKSVALVFALACILSVSLFSCSADEENVQMPVSDDYLAIAHEVLKDSVALYSTAMQGTVNKTLLEEGCPLKYYFTWISEDTLNMQIREFCVGKMPLVIWFNINVKFMQLNTWEKQEYTSEGWIKFKGTGGKVTFTAIDDEYEDGTGGSGSVTGYYNALTNEIEFVTNYNVMNMTSDVYLQTIDLTFIERYDEAFAQYEADLAAYKEAHGIN